MFGRQPELSHCVAARREGPWSHGLQGQWVRREPRGHAPAPAQSHSLPIWSPLWDLTRTTAPSGACCKADPDTAEGLPGRTAQALRRVAGPGEE